VARNAGGVDVLDPPPGAREAFVEHIEEFLRDQCQVRGPAIEMGDDPGFGIEIDLASSEGFGARFIGGAVGMGRSRVIDPPVELIVRVHRCTPRSSLRLSLVLFGSGLFLDELICRLGKKVSR